jgi:hypothetical protein
MRWRDGLYTAFAVVVSAAGGAFVAWIVLAGWLCTVGFL